MAGRFSGRLPERHFPHRQHLQAIVADHSDVQLAPLDIFLDQRIRVSLAVDEGDPLLELPLIGDHRSMRDPERSVLGRRLHEHGIPQPARYARPLAAGKHHELRRGNAVIGEKLLRQHLVAGQQHAAWIAAGVRLAHQL